MVCVPSVSSPNPSVYFRTIDHRSSFDFSVSHLGVLLHGEIRVLVLHGFLVEGDLWDGRDHFAMLQFILPLLDICIGSWMLRDWLAAAFLCEVLLLALRLVSVAVLWFALPAVGYGLLLPAVGFALLPAVGFDLLPAVGFALLPSRYSMFFSLSSYSYCFTSFFSPQARWLWFRLGFSHHWLFGCGSVCASSSESLCGWLRLRGSFLAFPNITTHHCALRDCWFAVGALDPRVTTTCSAVCEVWSERFSVSAARRCSPIPLCDTLSCVHLHSEGVHRDLLSRRGMLVRPTLLGGLRSSCFSIVWFVSLKIFVCLVTVTRYFPSRVLITSSLVIVICFATSFALRSAAIARLILDASLLHCTRAPRS